MSWLGGFLVGFGTGSIVSTLWTVRRMERAYRKTAQKLGDAMFKAVDPGE